MKLHVSKGNSKLGNIQSISFPPILTCPPNAPCKKKCYACKAYRQYPAVRNALMDNYDLYRQSPQVFYNEALSAIQAGKGDRFRWLVSGDMIDRFFPVMIDLIAKKTPSKKFLAYTKKHDLLDGMTDFADNLVIRRSLWGVDDLYKAGFPDGCHYAITILKGETLGNFRATVGNLNAIVCSGDCRTCSACWDKNVKLVIFNEH